MLREWLSCFIRGIPLFPLFIHKLDKCHITPENIKTATFISIFTQVKPRHRCFSTSEINSKSALRIISKNRVYILPIRIKFFNRILIFIRIVEMQQIPNHQLAVLANLDFVFFQTKNFSTAGKRSSIASTNPVNMGFFQLALVIDIHVMQTESPLLEF